MRRLWQAEHGGRWEDCLTSGAGPPIAAPFIAGNVDSPSGAAPVSSYIDYPCGEGLPVQQKPLERATRT